LIILGVKLKALKATLTPDQLIAYEQTISEEKLKMESTLEKLLTPEELRVALKSLDV
jgi:hypothetical protein